MSSSRYWELTVEVPEEASEGVTNLVWELGALGVVEEEAPGRPPRLRAFFPKTTFARALEESVREYLAGLRELGFPGAGRQAPADRPALGPAARERACGDRDRARPRLRHGPASEHARVPRAARVADRPDGSAPADRPRDGLGRARDRRGAARRRSGSRRRRRSRRRRLRDGQRGPQPGLRSRALRPR